MQREIMHPPGKNGISRNILNIPAPRISRQIPWLALWLILWILLVGKWDAAEIWVGTFASGLASIGFGIARAQVHGKFHLPPRLFLESWRIPGEILTGTWQTLEAMVLQALSRKGVPSAMLAVPFSRSPEKPPALAVLFSTSTPNMVALGFDERNGLLIYHQLFRTKVPRMLLHLGAAPDGPEGSRE